MISLLVDLSLDNTKPDKVCYVCKNIGDCTDIQHLRAQKKSSNTIKQTLSDIKLPDIDLIEYFDTDTVLACSKKAKDEEVEAVTNNFDLEADFLSDNEPEQPFKEANEQNKTAVSDNFDIGDIADIFAESSPEEAIEKEITKEVPEEKETNDALGFFGLDSIDDIFADDVIDDTPPELTAIPTKSNNTQKTKSQRAPNPENPLSPSILSGRPKAKDIPTSPILCSQPRKLSLSTKKDRAKCPTPFSRKQLIPETSNNSDGALKQRSVMKDSLVDTSNKSLMTITQLVDMINTTDSNTSAVNKNKFPERVAMKERSVSPILLTQAEKRKTSHYNETINSVASTSQGNLRCSLTILDSDSDSNDTQIYDVTKHFDNAGFINITSNSNKSPVTNKRKLDSSDTVTSSPYFNKKPKLESQNDKRMTLQEKVLAAISSSKLNKNNDSDKTVFNVVVLPPRMLSQKENMNPHFNGTKEDDDDKNNKLGALQMFRRDNKLKIDKSKFDAIFKKSPKKSELTQKRKLTFDDSDDDFICDEKSFAVAKRSPCQDANGSTTYHKVRKVSTYLRIYHQFFFALSAFTAQE